MTKSCLFFNFKWCKNLSCMRKLNLKRTKFRLNENFQKSLFWPSNFFFFMNPTVMAVHSFCQDFKVKWFLPIFLVNLLWRQTFLCTRYNTISYRKRSFKFLLACKITPLTRHVLTGEINYFSVHIYHSFDITKVTQAFFGLHSFCRKSPRYSICLNIKPINFSKPT